MATPKSKWCTRTTRCCPHNHRTLGPAPELKSCWQCAAEKRKGAEHCIRVDLEGRTAETKAKMVLGSDDPTDMAKWKAALEAFCKK
eukprot:SAG22_NODE_2507_length_2500_cov_1.565181_2_plen_86_part_00